MKIFNLPDLGEGLPDAEIVEWLVAEGDEVKLDEPLVSMETAKAVVEVPSPFTGKVAKFFGQEGDVIKTGKPLAGFDVEGEEDDEEPAPETADDNALGQRLSADDVGVEGLRNIQVVDVERRLEDAVEGWGRLYRISRAHDDITSFTVAASSFRLKGLGRKWNCSPPSRFLANASSA